MKVKGKWVYLYWIIDNRGHTIDFYLSPKRNAQAAKRFLGRAIKSIDSSWAYSSTINTYTANIYSAAITKLEIQGKCLLDIVHRQVKYLNNIIEADHGKLSN